MEWTAISKMIADLAPSILTAAGSFVPGGAMIGGVAGDLLKKAFGTAEPDKLAAAIAADPEAAMKLRMMEIQFQLEEKKLDLEETRSYLADVQSARAREVEIVKATGSRDVHLYILAWVMVSGFFALLGCLLFVTIPNDQSGVVSMLFGALSAGFGSVIGYFFGSSKGSADKAASISQTASLLAEKVGKNKSPWGN